MSYYRDTYVEVNLNHIAQNIHQLKERLVSSKKIYAVVKADAYGHGDIQVAEAALEAGAEGLAVAILDEALKLREAGVTAPLLVMGWIRPEDAALAAVHDIAVTVFQREWLDQAGEQALERPLRIHLKLDTGMGRIGVRSEAELDEILPYIDERPNFQLEALFTHFATADEADTTYLEEQQRRFDELFAHFEGKWQENVEIHTSNSAASMRFPEKTAHFVRFGISMYGLYPSQDVKRERPIDLQPAMSLHSQLIHVKQLEAGEAVSYGATYKAQETEWIGTVPIGYADGWTRKLQGMDVLVDGKRHPIVGRICMDQLMIRLDQEYPIGTKVTLIGKQEDQEISADDIASRLDTINYEVPCMIGSRVPRVYVKDGRIVDVKNAL
ncbi:alanine racemase [Halobacillus sp. ACCC02827]|uniref:alanine racemase n=1 Tax=Halobacillus sp. ACCC02827 TaxID=3052090 RepID=UPI0025711D15|nr:alanine racemase [Halobacillus sp. ACCC02827]WJE16170.1 alanine racemase [Halobacillus sp. ACCC02827]